MGIKKDDGLLTGVLAVDKPEGFTSFDVIAKLRGMSGERKVGHGGTLDPMATGVLPVFFGRATKAVNLLSDQTKRYSAVVLMGQKTDTGDRTGRVIEENGAVAGFDALQAAVERLSGTVVRQVPPMYSAVRVNGRRLYDLARRGETVERQPREIEIFEIRLTAYDPAARTFSFDLHCSKGSYVRTLAEEIGTAAGCLATLRALRRTRSGCFSEESCRTLDELQAARENGRFAECLLPADSLFGECRAVSLDAADAGRFLNGVLLPPGVAPPVGDGDLLRIYRDGAFLGLAEKKDGRLRKRIQFV